MRLAAIHPPLSAPWRPITVFAYTLQVGVKRHWPPSRGDTLD